MPTLTETETAAQERALTAVRAGCDDAEAMAYAKVGAGTWVYWCNETNFGDEVEEERGKLSVLAAGTVTKDMPKNPEIAQAFLEHQESQRNLRRLHRLTHPERYGDEAA